MKTIPLGNSDLVVLVDDEDYERVGQFNWTLLNKQKPHHPDYAYRRIWDKEKKKSGQNVLMHRFIMGSKKGEMLDHSDRNGLNNQKSNLRPTTQTLNNANQGKHENSVSPYKGVCWHKQEGKWYARCNRKSLGLFEVEIDAALAYDTAARNLWGEFAKVNFP